MAPRGVARRRPRRRGAPPRPPLRPRARAAAPLRGLPRRAAARRALDLDERGGRPDASARMGREDAHPDRDPVADPRPRRHRRPRAPLGRLLRGDAPRGLALRPLRGGRPRARPARLLPGARGAALRLRGRDPPRRRSGRLGGRRPRRVRLGLRAPRIRADARPRRRPRPALLDLVRLPPGRPRRGPRARVRRGRRARDEDAHRRRRLADRGHRPRLRLLRRLGARALALPRLPRPRRPRPRARDEVHDLVFRPVRRVPEQGRGALRRQVPLQAREHGRVGARPALPRGARVPRLDLRARRARPPRRTGRGATSGRSRRPSWLS